MQEKTEEDAILAWMWPFQGHFGHFTRSLKSPNFPPHLQNAKSQNLWAFGYSFQHVCSLLEDLSRAHQEDERRTADQGDGSGKFALVASTVGAGRLGGILHQAQFLNAPLGHLFDTHAHTHTFDKTVVMGTCIFMRTVECKTITSLVKNTKLMSKGFMETMC